VALVITDVSEEHIASIVMVERIGELGTAVAVTSSIRFEDFYGGQHEECPLLGYDAVCVL
jgi:hypothetical protein